MVPEDCGGEVGKLDGGWNRWEKGPGGSYCGAWGRISCGGRPVPCLGDVGAKVGRALEDLRVHQLVPSRPRGRAIFVALTVVVGAHG